MARTSSAKRPRARLAVRPLEPQDLEAMSELLEQLGYHASAQQLTERLERRPPGKDHGVLVAELRGPDDGVVGLLTFELSHAVHRATPECEVMTLVVHRHHRHRGVGRALLARAEGLARAAGCTRLHLRSNKLRDEAHAFYRRLGFDETHLDFVRTW